MAHNDYGAASWSQFTTAPEDPDAELTAPTLSSQRPFQQQLPPMYHNRHGLGGNPSASPIPGSNNPPVSVSLVPTSSYPSGSSTLPYMGSNRRPFFPPATNSYESYSVGRAPRPPPHLDLFDQPLASQTFYNSGINLHGSPSFPGRSGYSDPPLSGSFNAVSPFNPPRNDQRTSAGPPARNTRPDTVRSRGSPQGRHRGQPPGAPVRPREPRPPPQAPTHPREQTYTRLDQAQWISFPGPSRRSDRSTSPRASNRRNFERYSVDLSQSSTSSDAEEAAARAPPSNRMRHRPREVRPRFPGLHMYGDAEIAIARQINILKLGLDRHLPSTLPEDASKACDICQKDYATTLVTPTEEEENAIQLVCGHRFGEFCICQWFDTCREHKHKVTCPMCRAQLIDETRWNPPIGPGIPRGQAFIELLARAEMQAQDFQSHLDQS
ncbi:hypothetical protein G6011_06996 [Alternaria panax]|uniref:RING-type domain-containing protein n=1 Tax=Alternaria panax TaxID=48097 RepID=A0AAD4F983_9PLEO|nr:hypothetical protein G6011_06996 [Alternaria panax]